MRFTLFATAQGVRSESQDPLFATGSSAGIVTDASLSARKRGVRPGMLMRTAKALVPELTCTDEVDGLPGGLDKVLRIVLNFTPWIEVVDKSAFYFQIPSERPPLQEVKKILDRVNGQLTEEQNLQIGLAETPKLARALVEWNQVERVPGALYWRVGRQLWLIAPSLATVVSLGRDREHGGHMEQNRNREQGIEKAAKASAPAWIEEMPITAFFEARQSARDRLMSLGVYRIGELRNVPVSYLKRQFGEESLSWTEFSRKAVKQLRVNYPLKQFVREWVPDVGEEVSGEQLSQVVDGLALKLANELRRNGLGALKVSVRWNSGEGYEKALKQPVYEASRMVAAVTPAYTLCEVEELSLVQLYAEEIQPLTSVQMALSEQKPEERRGTVDVFRVVRHLNRKYPDVLHMGIRPSFRELRLQAVLEGGGDGSAAGSIMSSSRTRHLS